MVRRLLAAVILCLTGILSGNSQDFPTLAEIYDYEPGDVFETAHYFCCNEVFFQIERRTIEKKIVFDEKTGYVTTRSLFELLYEEPYKIADTSLWKQPDTLWILSPDSIIFEPEDEVIKDPALYQGREIYIRKYFLLNSLCEERYVKGCGMVYKGWGTPPSTTTTPQDSLTWYCKPEECWGKSLLVLRVSIDEEGFLIHPNPVNQLLTITSNHPSEIRKVRLLDMNTGILRQMDEYVPLHQSKIHIPVAHLTTGVYFLSIDTDKGTFVHKIIKL